MGTLVGSPRGFAKVDAEFSSNPNAYLFDNIEIIQEEQASSSSSSEQSMGEEDK